MEPGDETISSQGTLDWVRRCAGDLKSWLVSVEQGRSLAEQQSWQACQALHSALNFLQRKRYTLDEINAIF